MSSKPAVVTAAVAVVAVALLGLSDRGQRAIAATGGTRAASGLIARLAVLRRAQTPADRLPSDLNLRAADLSGVVPSLTRLLGQVGAVRIYLVVSTPRQSATALWRPDLGDQASLLLVDGTRATDGFTFPAAELDDASFLTPLAAITPRSHEVAQLVPDGVARVRVRYVNSQGRTLAGAVTTVQGNLALSTPVLQRAIPRRERFGVRPRVTWYRADGSVVPTSNRGLRLALAAQQRAIRRQLLRAAEHSGAPAPASLLRAFAVFSVHGARGVTRDGVTVSAPPLRSVPTSVLEMFGHRGPGGISRDVHELRRVRTRGGHIVWVIPGATDLCISAAMPSGIPGVRGASGSCSEDVASAERTGVGISSNGTIQVGVVPTAHPTVRFLIHGRVRTLRPPFGVYYLTHARRVR